LSVVVGRVRKIVQKLLLVTTTKPTSEIRRYVNFSKNNQQDATL